MLEFRELPESKIKISQLNYVNFDKLQPRLACFIVIVQHPHAMMSPQRTISIRRHWFSSLSRSPSLPTTANPLHIKNSFPILWAHENCVQCLSILWVPSVFYILKRFMWLISTAVARWKEYSSVSSPNVKKKLKEGNQQVLKLTLRTHSCGRLSERVRLKIYFVALIMKFEAKEWKWGRVRLIHSKHDLELNI